MSRARSGVNPAFRVFTKEMYVHGRTIYTELAYVILFPIMLLGTMRLGLGNKVSILGVEYVEFIMPGIIVMSVITTAFFNTGFVMLFEKEYAGSFQGLVITPIAPREIVFGKVLSGAVKSLINGVLITLVLVVAVDYRPPASIVLLPVILFVAAFFFSALGIMFGVVLKKGYQLGTIGNLIIVPLTFMGGMFFDVGELGGAARWGVEASPVTHMITDCREVMVWGGWDIAFGLAFNLLLCAVAFWGAVKIFERAVYK
jgi:ABC-2 type transport system permease protein